MYDSDDLIAYKKSMDKLDELIAEFGYEIANEKHKEWLKETDLKEEFNNWRKALPPEEREQFEMAFLDKD